MSQKQWRDVSAKETGGDPHLELLAADKRLLTPDLSIENISTFGF